MWLHQNLCSNSLKLRHNFFSFSFSIIEIADVNLWQIASLLNNLGKVHPLSCHLASPKSYYRYYISESILLQHQVH